MRIRGLIVVIALLSFIAAPVAIAADGCSGMGAVCGAPCSAPCLSVSAATGSAVPAPVAPLVQSEPATVRAGVLKVLDAPPKFLPFA